MKKKIATHKNVCVTFKIHPTQLYGLEARGKLPARPHGVITVEYLEALEAWHKHARGDLPQEAIDLLKRAKKEKEA